MLGTSRACGARSKLRVSTRTNRLLFALSGGVTSCLVLRLRACGFPGCSGLEAHLSRCGNAY